jgi:diguanylate cyclase (GGDEF)-like protein/PAS domain S-box-containing protein
MQSLWPWPFRLRRPAIFLVVRAAGLGALYFVSAEAIITLASTSLGFAGVWISNALALAVLLRQERGPSWPSFVAILSGGLLANVASGISIGMALPLMVANLAEIACALLLIRRVRLPVFQFGSDLYAFIRLLLLAALIAPALSASLAALVWMTRGLPVQAGWWAWWSADAAGAVAILPIALSVSRRSLRGTFGGRTWWRLPALAALCCGVAYAAGILLDHPTTVASLPLLAAALISTPLGTALLAGLATITLTAITYGSPGYLAVLLTASLLVVMPFSVCLLVTRLRAERVLIAESEERFRNAMEHAAIGMGLAAPDGRWIRVNRSLCEMLGYREDEFLRLTAYDISSPDDVGRVQELTERMLRGNADSYRIEMRYVHKSGAVIWVQVAASAVRSHDGVPHFLIMQVEDISERYGLTEALSEEKDRLQVTLQSIGDAVISTDTHCRIVFMNPAAEILTRWSHAEAIGRPLEEVLQIIEVSSGLPVPSKAYECLRNLAPASQREGVKLIREPGEARDIRQMAAPLHNSAGGVIGAVLICQDITEALRMEERLKHAATHDPLTGLDNRSSFEARLGEARARIGSGRQHAVCFIDLDRFKIVNDTAGHAAGDALLRTVATVIKENARAQDVTARIGGDEFGLLLFDCNVDQARKVANKIITAVGAVPFLSDGRTYEIGASAGIAMLSGASSDAKDLLSEADVACYTAKALGRNQVAVYEPGAGEAHRHLRAFQVAVSIRTAIEDGRFRLYAQEIRSLTPTEANERNFELLLRMEDEAGNLLEPSAFIPAAERFDLMGSIDRWVIGTALGRFGARLADEPNLSISINLSANSLSDPHMWPFLEAQLHASRLPADRLHLEITESGLIKNMTASTNLLASARAAGCRIVLDDFGTGLSSFAYLRSFPIDYLKIDGSFMTNLKGSPVDRTIVEAINNVGHRLGARTIAEWVEDEATVAILREIGVDEVQGYVIGRPIALDELLAEPNRTPEAATRLLRSA